jgi:cytochrome P450
MFSSKTTMLDKQVTKVDVLKGSFLLGSTLEILKNPVLYLSKLTNSYGPVVVVSFSGKKYYVFQHPDYIKHVLLDNHKHYCKPGATKLLRLFLGEGLSTSNGELWLKQRRLMQPAFHKERLVQLADMINEETSKLICRLNALPHNSTININRETLQLTISIISRAMFSSGLNNEMQQIIHALEELASFATNWMKSVIKIPTTWPTPANNVYWKNCEIFDNIINSIIERRRKQIMTHNAPNDLLTMLMESYDEDTKSSMSQKQLRDEVATLFMAGHETSAQTLSWTLYHLAASKEIYTKIKKEVIQILDSSQPSFENIASLTYTNQVLQETLRHYPPIWALVRRPLLNDYIDGLHLATGSNVLLNIYGLHHHPTYWQTPQTFNPSHFDKEAEQSRPPYVFIPFGAGPRLCLGHSFAMLVMKIVVTRLVMAFEFSVPEGYVPAIEPNITLRAKNGIPLIINKRCKP